MCWMSAIFLLPVCLTYWLRKYTTRVDPNVDNSPQVWSRCDHTLPSYSVFVCWYVTRPCDLLTFDLLTWNRCHTWRVTWPTLPPSIKTYAYPFLSSEFPVGYHWKWVGGHCSCAESRDPWVGVKNNYSFGMLDPDLHIHYATSVALRWK